MRRKQTKKCHRNESIFLIDFSALFAYSFFLQELHTCTHDSCPTAAIESSRAVDAIDLVSQPLIISCTSSDNRNSIKHIKKNKCWTHRAQHDAHSFCSDDLCFNAMWNMRDGTDIFLQELQAEKMSRKIIICLVLWSHIKWIIELFLMRMKMLGEKLSRIASVLHNAILKICLFTRAE